MKKFLLFLLLSSVAHADLTLGVGSSTGIFGSPGTPFVRMVAIGYQKPFATDYFIRAQVQYFEDLSGNGAESGFLASLPVGVRALSSAGIELNLSIGPAWLQNPDTVLGGHFQFNLEGGACTVDPKTAICIEWHHDSSANIYPVNHGRDWLEILLRILTF